MSNDIYYSFILLIKQRISQISINSFSLNMFSSLLPHLSKIIGRTDVLSKIYDILGIPNFLHLLHFFLSSPFQNLFIE